MCVCVCVCLSRLGGSVLIWYVSEVGRVNIIWSVTWQSKLSTTTKTKTFPAPITTLLLLSVPQAQLVLAWRELWFSDRPRSPTEKQDGSGPCSLQRSVHYCRIGCGVVAKGMGWGRNKMGENSNNKNAWQYFTLPCLPRDDWVLYIKYALLHNLQVMQSLLSYLLIFLNKHIDALHFGVMGKLFVSSHCKGWTWKKVRLLQYSSFWFSKTPRSASKF